jgi:hypothetical protein
MIPQIGIEGPYSLRNFSAQPFGASRQTSLLMTASTAERTLAYWCKPSKAEARRLGAWYA